MGSGCGPCFRCSFPLCCHPQFQILRKLSQEPVATAMPSAVTPRQLTLLSWPERIPMGRKKRGHGKKWGLGETKGLTALRTLIVGFIPKPLRVALSSCTTCYSQYVANKNKHTEEHLCMTCNHYQWDWPKNHVVGKGWLAETSHNCSHPGVMVGLRTDGVLDKTEIAVLLGYKFSEARGHI